MRYFLAIVLGCILVGCGKSASESKTADRNRAAQSPASASKVENGRSEPGPDATPVSLFSRGHLTTVDIKISESAWTALRSQTRSMATALRLKAGPRPFSYFRGDVTINGKPFKSVGIRKKGFIGSLDNERPSLKIKFNHFGKSKRTFEGVDRLTLNNNKQDRSLASQYLAYDLFDRAGVPAPRCNLAVVTVNGRNLGVYSNVEAVKTPFLKRHFGNSKGTIYEGTLTDLYTDRLDRFDSKVNKKWARKRGREILRSLCLALEPTDTAAMERLNELVDLREFMTFWAVESLIGFWDGYSGNQNNFFVYVPEKSKVRFVPWGIDAAFTNRRFGFRSGGYKSVFAKGLLANRLNHDPAMREKYHTVMRRILEEAWDEELLNSDLDRIAILARKHIHPRQRGFENSLEQVRRFVRNRRAEIEAETSDGAIAVEREARRPMYSVAIGKLSGSFQTRWNGADGDPIPQSSGAKIRGERSRGSFAIGNLSAIAKMGQARRWSRGGMQPTITLSGIRSPDGESVTITIVVPQPLFRSGAKRIKVQGRFSEGERRRGWGSGMLDGRLNLRRAGGAEGDNVAGDFSLDVYEMRGRW